MKAIKKLVVLALVAIMTMGMSVTAFADEAQTNVITVNAPEGATISYVKVLEANRKTTTGYSFVEGYADTFETQFTAEGAEKDEQATIKSLIALATGDYTNVTAINGSTALAAALDGVTTGFTSAGTVATGETSVTISGVTTGLYVIKAELEGYSYIPMLAYVDNAGTVVTVNAKGDSITVSKDTNEAGQSVAAGDVVDFTITVEYPYFAPNTENQTFKVFDKLTNATFNKDSVSFDGVTGTASFNEAKDEMTVTFGDYDSSKAGTTVTITYSVTANDDVATTKLLTNKVDATFGKDTDSTTVTTDTAKVQVLKYGSAETEVLEGATFDLYVVDANATDKIPYTELTGSKVTFATTDSTGYVTFDGLDVQKTYYVVETEAPAGYSIDGKAHEVKFSGKITADSNEDGITYSANDFDTLKVSDTQLSALPFTGGIGTTIFTIAGVVIMVLAAALYFATKKKTANN